MNDQTTVPPTVRRWLDRTIPAGRPVPAKLSNTQVGEMDIRGKWTPFTAQTVYQANPFTFRWQAHFRLIPGVWLTATDAHDSSTGWGEAKLWGLIPMGGRRGPEVLAMQLVRSLAELPWLPQLIPAIPGLTWQEDGTRVFSVSGVWHGQEITVGYRLDENDDVVRSFGRRYYDVPDGFVEAPWHYEFSGHRDLGGVRIPSNAVARYEKADGLWEYWRGRILTTSPGP